MQAGTTAVPSRFGAPVERSGQQRVLLIDTSIRPTETCCPGRDRRVRCLQRIGRRGLTTACIEGALATSAPYIAIIDADMQHDETPLPRMLAILKTEPVDLVVGSR